MKKLLILFAIVGILLAITKKVISLLKKARIISILVLATLFLQTNILAQETIDSNKDKHIFIKNWAVPTTLAVYGVASLKLKPLIHFNHYLNEKVLNLKIAKSNIDNYTQYAPALEVYALNIAGIHGRHNFAQRCEILALALAINGVADLSLKNITKEERPDKSNNLSFPSGHTSTAFATAQFMFEEYRDYNFLLSISGYAFALYTGAYRIIDNKHWFGDVVAGAGIGMLSTEMAYWLYPKIRSLFHQPTEYGRTAFVMPYYNYGSMGLSLNYNF